MSQLFTPLKIREVTFKNRIFVSPMCQYSSIEGLPTEWHMVHLGSRAVGGAGLIITEATAVVPEGRISPDDMGIWSDKHAEALKPITRFLKEHGSVPGIQLGHAGRKASTAAPWLGGKPVDEHNRGWQTVAPSAVPFGDYPAPVELTKGDLQLLLTEFKAAAVRSLEAGFEVAELHMAHGYLLHQFMSPLSNKREDEYGGSYENRVRFPLEVAKAVRDIWPQTHPLFVRISVTDWAEGGWDLEQSIELAKEFKKIGIDFVDCSSGGLVSYAKIPARPGYQVRFAEEIRKNADIPTGAVGIITQPNQAEQILVTGQADAVLLAREFLRDPYWPLHAAKALGDDIEWPVQYQRAKR
ncbi:MAG TPA: NADH:flavin oxidoreductase/NADH oxidase [Balneolales bacterium]|nr:NADH:flavin oxidoreductase/NADH oxidase [Balneolales bacterium]